MKKLLATSGTLFLIMALFVAATVDGSWKGYVEGQYNVTADLKVAGTDLTGTFSIIDNNAKSENPDDSGYSPFVAAQLGKNVITNGKLEGEAIAFSTMFNGKPVNYKGTMIGEKLVLTTSFNEQPVKITLSRAK
ncbi:hypothetical protein [Daejeonella sp.]|uniref:hypothetical protein n=1 Tax=Daejeonella sp. TaxID=2805397 RepID=UPI003982FD5D